ncbi:hypothetical protein GCM10022255_031170 [Dactylosporangium darangshiense]|uniref:Uncharacterized protein n=1 Tax=Dactylosporangium darangshiense TaxID=579108 RepID=A0ABP8D704_9ACTN
MAAGDHASVLTPLRKQLQGLADTRGFRVFKCGGYLHRASGLSGPDNEQKVDRIVVLKPTTDNSV